MSSLQIAPKVTAENRLKVRGSISDEIDVSQSGRYLTLADAQILIPIGKGLVQNWNPQRSVVTSRGQETPKAKRKLRNDFSVGGRFLRPFNPCYGLGNVLVGMFIKDFGIKPTVFCIIARIPQLHD